ncbi:DUF2262 domain-containing protein [Paenibacillus elgii]|uniref:DUF2262 domain-containing protein n=1 Tax=Paenibacillus elgii TaxID=189691 RepID=UPI000FD9E230|nr:DUF2262 domain-containing protein [Paenibacillus elgii]NEN82616.1 DUF2262 domain-containing protein [Paenibacillus elgii]
MNNVEIQDEFWGMIVKDRDIDLYTCRKLLKGEEIEVAFMPDEDDLHEVIEYAKEIFAHLEENDMAFREYAADEVLNHCREYIVEGAVITKEELANRMWIESFSVGSGKSFDLSYNDDGICGNHIIMVFVDEQGEPCGVDIAG